MEMSSGICEVPALAVRTQRLPMEETSKRRLTPKEAARRLNCSVSYLAKKRMTGTGPKFIRHGRAIRYTEQALDDYEAANERSSTSEY